MKNTMLTLKLEFTLIMWKDFGHTLKPNLNECMAVTPNGWTHIWMNSYGCKTIVKRKILKLLLVSKNDY